MEKIVVEPDLCKGCSNCVKACRGLYGTSRIKIKKHNDVYYSITCQQCANAPCKVSCPTGAMHGKGVERSKCIGCGQCIMACPFGAISLGDKAQKCNQCEGREEGQACIRACSRRAISLVSTDKIRLQKQKEYLSKLSGTSKKSTGLLNILTSDTKAKKSLCERLNI